MKRYNRVCAAIDLDAVRFNLEQMKQNIAKDTKVMAVIKTDGYGHGAVPIAHEIEAYEYVFGFAVATIEEAVILRKNHIKKPILILGYTFSDSYEEMIHREIRGTVFKYDMAKELSDRAVQLGKKAFVHIKVDTGMSRIGVNPNNEGIQLVKKIAALPNIMVEGIFTHFAKADEKDKKATYEQIKKFRDFVDALRKENITIPVKHCSNSAGIVEVKEANMDVVRAGITLYGLWPSNEVDKNKINLKPVLSLKSKIVYIKEIEEGSCVSYGGTFKAAKRMKIATIPVGYGDGYPRSLSNKGFVLIDGKKAPIIGRVCMDQFMVDITHMEEVKELDEVVLVGKSKGAVLTVEELGELSGRFNYEFVCDLGRRIPRIYIKNGRVTETRDCFSMA